MSRGPLHKMIAFGWMNFSAADIKRTREAIAELKAPGSIDELGISIIRDGFADKLFPGLNVMQTSLKYYLLLPAMLLQIERKLEIRENEDIQYRLLERLIDMECDFCDRAVEIAPDLDGIIGKDSHHEPNHAKRMLRFPHHIYWHGLDVFGLLPGNSSSPRSFCEGVRERKKFVDDEPKRNSMQPWGEEFAIYETIRLKPAKPEDPEAPAKPDPLKLNKGEYEFLKQKILRSEVVKDTALEILLKQAEKMPGKVDSARDIREVLRALGDRAEGIAKKTAYEAGDFGIFMRCAFLAYNIAYRMYCGDLGDEIANYYNELHELHGQVADLTIPAEFDFERKKGRTLAAMKRFHEFLRRGIPSEPRPEILEEIRQMMTSWETAAGKRVCHLKKPDPRPENIEWIGMEYLDFRYNTAERLFADYIG